jgi:Glycosyl hydrolase catalytic core
MSFDANLVLIRSEPRATLRWLTRAAFGLLGVTLVSGCSGEAPVGGGTSPVSPVGGAAIGGGAAGLAVGGSDAVTSVGGSSATGGAGGLGVIVGSSGAPLTGGTAGAPESGGGMAGTGGSGGSSVGNGGVAGASGGSGSNSAGAGGGNNPGGAPFKGVAGSQDGFAITPCAARALLKVSWYYNWTQSGGTPCANGQGGAFVPMIWGHADKGEQSVDGITQAISSLVSKNYPYVLGFNEPNKSDQSNIGVPLAISLLPAFDNPAISVGTPATSADAAGQTWFKDYMGQVNSSATLRADFIVIHWYGWNAGSCDASASQLEGYIKYAEGFAGNRPIWLTEWSCLNASAPTAAGVLAFYQGALSVFAKHPRVQRYAWYPFTTNCELNNADGSLTPLGVAYANAPATK